MNAELPLAATSLEQALGRFAAGVVVVADPGTLGTPRCVVASAFNSLSLDPALLLWCVPRTQGHWLGIDRAYGLSVLSERQTAIVDTDALQREPQAWEYGDHLGAPILRDAAAWFEVVAVRRIPHGDHDLYLAEVAGHGYAKELCGLLRYSGRVARTEACV